MATENAKFFEKNKKKPKKMALVVPVGNRSKIGYNRKQPNWKELQPNAFMVEPSVIGYRWWLGWKPRKKSGTYKEDFRLTGTVIFFWFLIWKKYAISSTKSLVITEKLTWVHLRNNENLVSEYFDSSFVSRLSLKYLMAWWRYRAISILLPWHPTYDTIQINFSSNRTKKWYWPRCMTWLGRIYQDLVFFRLLFESHYDKNKV